MIRRVKILRIMKINSLSFVHVAGSSTPLNNFCCKLYFERRLLNCCERFSFRDTKSVYNVALLKKRHFTRPNINKTLCTCQKGKYLNQFTERRTKKKASYKVKMTITPGKTKTSQNIFLNVNLEQII